MSTTAGTVDDTFRRQRRAAIAAHSLRMGIDYVTVAEPTAAGSREVTLHFIPADPGTEGKHDALDAVTPENVVVAAVATPRSELEILAVDHPAASARLRIRVAAGDGDPVLLRSPRCELELVAVADLDPFFSRVGFSLALDLPERLDCAQGAAEEAAPPAPAISYLARDYVTFRQLIIERLSALLPEWQERNPADGMIAVAEVLADAADQLSYFQDAVATEAYLGTARHRISVRRHARLLDYPMHEGNNARVWVQIRVAGTGPPTAPTPVVLPEDTRILTRASGRPVLLAPASDAWQRALESGALVFETSHQANLYAEHNDLAVYTWGAAELTLARGATRTTLAGALPNLAAGDVLVFEERVGPLTGRIEDADPEHRHAVRLSRVSAAEDPLGGELFDRDEDGIGTLSSTGATVTGTGTVFTAQLGAGYPLTAAGETRIITAVTSDALLTVDAPFSVDLAGESFRFRPLAMLTGTVESAGTAVTGSGTAFLSQLAAGDLLIAGGQRRRITAVTSDTALSVDAAFSPELAAGTLFTRSRQVITEIEWLDDDALPFDLILSTRLDDVLLGGVSLVRGNVVLADHGRSLEEEDLEPGAVPESERYRPGLALRPMTWRVPYDHAAALTRGAGLALAQDPREAVPALELRDDDGDWIFRRDLLASDRFAREYVVEMEGDGTARLRFGDGTAGRLPTPGTVLRASYRVGNGAAGNVGPESLAHAVSLESRIIGVVNPLAAQGGTDPEPLEQVRLSAPLRSGDGAAATMEQFATAALTHPEVELAATSLSWTGSWHVLVVGVRLRRGRPLDDAITAELFAILEDLRQAGWELEVAELRTVGLDVALTITAEPDHVAAAVERDLLTIFSNRDLPDGRRGFFHPANLGLGRPVYLSKIVTTALAVPGVVAVDYDDQPPRINRFRIFGQPSRGEVTAGRIRLRRLEIPRVDNDPEKPEHGRIRFFVQGGR